MRSPPRRRPLRAARALWFCSFLALLAPCALASPPDVSFRVSDGPPDPGPVVPDNSLSPDEPPVDDDDPSPAATPAHSWRAWLLWAGGGIVFLAWTAFCWAAGPGAPSCMERASQACSKGRLRFASAWVWLAERLEGDGDPHRLRARILAARNRPETSLMAHLCANEAFQKRGHPGKVAANALEAAHLCKALGREAEAQVWLMIAGQADAAKAQRLLRRQGLARLQAAPLEGYA
jgi:hypothetical protein